MRGYYADTKNKSYAAVDPAGVGRDLCHRFSTPLFRLLLHLLLYPLLYLLV
jgi:hypothetical protein